MGCSGALLGSYATQILTNILTFLLLNYYFFYFKKMKVDFKLDLDENCANTETTFHLQLF